MSKPVNSLLPSFWNSKGAKVGSVATRNTFSPAAFFSPPPQPATNIATAAMMVIIRMSSFFICISPLKFLNKNSA